MRPPYSVETQQPSLPWDPVALLANERNRGAAPVFRDVYGLVCLAKDPTEEFRSARPEAEGGRLLLAAKKLDGLTNIFALAVFAGFEY